jgi:hypothetical protein
MTARNRAASSVNQAQVLGAAGMSWNGNEWVPTATEPRQLTLKGEATLALSTAAQGLAAATLVTGGTGIPNGSTYAHVTLEGGKIRYLLTGTPTSNLGKLLSSAINAEVEFELENAAELNGFKAIAISGAPILTITYKG